MGVRGELQGMGAARRCEDRRQHWHRATKRWIEHDKSDLSSLDDAVYLRSLKAKDGEEERCRGGRCEPLCGRG